MDQGIALDILLSKTFYLNIINPDDLLNYQGLFFWVLFAVVKTYEMNYVAFLLLVMLSISFEAYAQKITTVVHHTKNDPTLQRGIRYLLQTDSLLKAAHYRGAIQKGKKALITFEKITQTDSLQGYTCYLIGISYQFLRRLYKSEMYYQVALHKFQRLSRQVKRVVDIHNMLGALYHSIHPSKAVIYFKKVLETRPKYKAVVFNNISLAYAYQKHQNDSALFYAQQALQSLEPAIYPAKLADRLQAAILHNMGIAYLQKKDFLSAVRYFQKSLALLEKLKAHRHPLYYYNHLKLGETYLQQQWLSAIAHFKIAVKRAKQAKNELAYLQALSGQTQALSKHHWANFKKLDLTLSHYRKCDSMIRRLQKRRDFYRDRLDFATLMATTYEAAFAACFRLYRQNPQPKYINQAFYFMERAKAQVLWQALQAAKAKTQQAASRQLLDSLTTTRYQMNRAQSGNYQWHAKFLRLYQQTQPNRLDTNITDTLQRLAQIRPKLRNTTALIEYFVAANHLYGWVMTNNRPTYLTQLGRVATLDSLVEQFHDLLQEPEEYKLLVTNAHALYKKLIQPFARFLTNKKHLVIIPEQQLWKVPFSVLSTKVPKLISQRKQSHLVHQYAISYHYSANLWATPSGIDTVTTYQGKLLGVAPGFLNSQWGVDALPQSLQEIDTLSKIYQGQSQPITLLKNQRAVLDTFLRAYLQGYQTVHLSTHSEAGQWPHIKLLPTANQAIDRCYLHLDHIYHLPPKTQLLVLNSCSTGDGQLHRTEGLLGLSRGFIQIGIPNVLFNLWDVADDTTTVNLMARFHQAILQKGMGYARALQLAKIKALQNQLAYPIDWASFMLLSNYQRQ